MSSPVRRNPLSRLPRAWRPVWVCTATGVALRAAFLLLAGDLDFVRDEGHYTYLALSWNHFGFYSDSYRYLWPPGYAYFLGRCLAWFGAEGLAVAKGLQVLASASIGASTVLLAGRLFGRRAAWIAGALWATYLPLVGFTHALWNETVFLACFAPALYQVVAAVQEPERDVDRRLIAAGLLLAAALYVKEAPFYLVPLLAAIVGWAGRAVGPREALRRGLLLPLVVAAALAPWALRNAEVYGRFVPVGSSLGENVFRGLNATYRNFDLAPFRRAFFWREPPESRSRRWWIDARGAQDWVRAEEIRNTPDRLAENVRRGVRFAAERPGWLLRTRVKKLADLVTPISFFVRNQGLGVYAQGPLGADGPRQVLVLAALLAPALALLGAVPGLLLLPPRLRLLLGAVLGYFVATSLVVAMSRFRVPMAPLLIALCAGFLARGLPSARRGAWAATALGWGALGFLWWLDLPETLSILDFVWHPA